MTFAAPAPGGPVPLVLPESRDLEVWVEGGKRATVASGRLSALAGLAPASVDFEQTDAAKRMLVLPDHFGSGRDGYQGDGADDLLTSSGAATFTGDFSLVFVFETTTVATRHAAFVSGPGDLLLKRDSERWRQWTGTQGVEFTAAGVAVEDNTRYVLEVYRSSGELTAWLNSVDISANPKANVGTDLGLGSLFGSGAWPNDFIWGAWLGYSSALSAALAGGRVPVLRTLGHIGRIGKWISLDWTSLRSAPWA